jgi:hypothetical protein
LRNLGDGSDDRRRAIALMVPYMYQPAVESGSDVDFTLDPTELAERRAVRARRLHTVQVPI